MAYRGVAGSSSDRVAFQLTEVISTGELSTTTTTTRLWHCLTALYQARLSQSQLAYNKLTLYATIHLAVLVCTVSDLLTWRLAHWLLLPRGTFTPFLYATAATAVVHISHRNSVCPYVCPSHGWISQKRCKLGSPNLHHRLPGRLCFRNCKAFP